MHEEKSTMDLHDLKSDRLRKRHRGGACQILPRRAFNAFEFDQGRMRAHLARPRAPNIAVPIRTCVAPKRMAVSKFAHMPMLTPSKPRLRAILSNNSTSGARRLSPCSKHTNPKMRRFI